MSQFDAVAVGRRVLSAEGDALNLQARTQGDAFAQAGEILATAFDFGEPADPVEIGDGVRVAIAKA